MLDAVIDARQRFVRLGWVSRHTHSMRGGDGVACLKPKQLLEWALERGITVLYLNDHTYLDASFEMMEHIRLHIGHNLGTRCLAWSAGEVSNLELYQAIKEEAELLGKDYRIPKLED